MNTGIWKCLLAGGAAACMLLAGCSAEKREPESYEDVGMELIALMDEKAENAAYIEAMGSSEDIKAYTMQFGEGDYAKAQAVYEIKLPIEDFVRLAEIDMTGMSEKLRLEMTNRIAESIGSMLNGKNGMLSLASAAMLTSTVSFFGEVPEKPLIYLYQFDSEAYPAMVVFAPAGEGIVKATAMFVDNKELNGIDIETEIQEVLGSVLDSSEVRELLGGADAIEVRKLD